MLRRFWFLLCCMLSREYKITSLGIRNRFQPGFRDELQLYCSSQNIIQIVAVTWSGHVTSFEVINAHVHLTTTRSSQLPLSEQKSSALQSYSPICASETVSKLATLPKSQGNNSPLQRLLLLPLKVNDNRGNCAWPTASGLLQFLLEVLAIRRGSSTNFLPIFLITADLGWV